MRRTVEFVVYGDPIPKGSTTRLPNGMTIDGAPSRSKDKVKRKAQRDRRAAWPVLVREAAALALDGADTEALPFVNAPPLSGPLSVSAQFFFARPKAHARMKDPPRWHTTKPDVDKLLRGIFDPLKKAGVIRDDCWIAHVGNVEKRYVTDLARFHVEWPLRVTPGIERPRAVVRVSEIAATE